MSINRIEVNKFTIQQHFLRVFVTSWVATKTTGNLYESLWQTLMYVRLFLYICL